MKNIIDYIKEESRSFEELPLNQVDSLIFSNFIYMRLESIFKENKKCVEIRDALKREYFSEMFTGIFIPGLFASFVHELAASPRFRNIKIKYYENINDTEREKQFAAICFIINDKQAYIAFRGTDDSINGWKEDFNMAFKCPIPSQEEALKYVNRVSKKLPHTLYLGGHSKGGNLAVYALVKSSEVVQNRIETVFSHDGPGFKQEFIESQDFEKVKLKIKKTLPQSSIVGMLFQTQEEYKIVNSDAFFILQHDPFSWQVKDVDFDYVENLSGGAKYTNITINKWINDMPNDKRERFINQMFMAIYSTGETTFTGLANNWRVNLPILMRSFKDLDDETKSIVYSIIRELGKFWIANYSNIDNKEIVKSGLIKKVENKKLKINKKRK